MKSWPRYALLLVWVAAALQGWSQIGYDTLRQDAVMKGYFVVRGGAEEELADRARIWQRTEFHGRIDRCSADSLTCNVGFPLGPFALRGRMVKGRELDMLLAMSVVSDTVRYDVSAMVYSHDHHKPDRPRVEVQLGERFREGVNSSERMNSILRDELYSLEVALRQRITRLGNALAMPAHRRGQGTCFLVGKDGYLITNHHVVDGSGVLNVRGIGGDISTPHRAHVVATDVGSDLALIKLDDPPSDLPEITYKIRSNGVQQGERVYALGYPRADVLGEELKVNEGMVSSRSGAAGDVSMFQISAILNPGNSGGPLVDQGGALIGVVFAKSSVADAAGYARKATYLESFLANIDSLPRREGPVSLPMDDAVQIVSNWSRFVFLIEAE